MITAEASQKEEFDSLFEKSIYQNKHLGWLDLWSLADVGGTVRIDQFREKYFLLGIQPSGNHICWLHSFYASGDPEGYPLHERMKSCLPAGRHSVYSISSHNWYCNLLKKNGFTKCDEIIQMETAEIILPKNNFDIEPSDFSTSQTEEIRRFCEPSFPPLWRFSEEEFSLAVKTSNYKIVIKVGTKTAAYLLADISDDNCHIQRIAVSPEYQNLGAGSKLVHKMINDARSCGINNFSVNTNSNNKAACHFYKVMNFKILDEIFPVYHEYVNTDLQYSK